MPGAKAGSLLFETLTALLLVAILLGLAQPAIQRYTANQRVVSAAEAIASGLDFARYSAITTGKEITICPSEDGRSCLAGQWHRNWIVFLDRDGDSNPDPGEILRSAALEAPVTTSGFDRAIIFRSSGTTTLESDAVITSCYHRSEVTDRCMGVTVRALGAIEPSEAAASPGV